LVFVEGKEIPNVDRAVVASLESIKSLFLQQLGCARNRETGDRKSQRL
jgi:superfamily II DNA or RNA helicase